MKAVGLADVVSAAGVSSRALQKAFRRFRDTTPMAHLRALRLDLARSRWPEPRAAAVRSLRSRLRTGSGHSAGSRPITERASTSRLQKRYDAAPSDGELLGNCDVHRRDFQ